MSRLGRRKIRHAQKRVPGMKREPLPACVWPEIFREVDSIAIRFGVSRSWVIATVLAEWLHIKGHTPYYVVSPKLKRVK